MTRVLVTGAAGFLGSHVAEALVARGETVTGLDNFDGFYARATKEANLAGLVPQARFTLVEGDIRDAALVRSLLGPGDVVVHLAARAGVRPSLEDPALYASVNVTGTTVLLEAARAAGAAFVFAGSSSVYGDSAAVPFREDEAALHPISPYAATKRAAELMCSTFVHLYGMRIMSLRFFTAYGPRQRPDLAIHRFASLMAAGQAVPQFGDGSTERDYTWVDDVVQGVVAARDWAARPDGAAFEIVNLGESRTVRLDRLIALIGEALGVTPVIERRPMQPGDVRRTCADISRARALLGYQPTTAIEDGIPRFIRWFKEAHGRQI